MCKKKLCLAICIMVVGVTAGCSKKPRTSLLDVNSTYDTSKPSNVVFKESDVIEQSPSSEIVEVETEVAQPVATAPVAAPPLLDPVGDIAPTPFTPIPVPPPPIIEYDDHHYHDDKCEDKFCGDGIKQRWEDCDDGNDENDDGCDNFCREPECGNGIIEGVEECDIDHISCVDCRLILCGNNVVEDSEECDPPNTTDCRADCTLSVCGNGEVDPGEDCDDGNTVDDGNGCSSSCTLSCTVPAL